jgi:hypothetical protein
VGRDELHQRGTDTGPLLREKAIEGIPGA